MTRRPDAEPSPDDYAAASSTGSATRQLRLAPDALRSLAADVIEQLTTRLDRVTASTAARPTEAQFHAFVDALLREGDHAARDVIDAARASGAPLDAIYLGYLAPAARRLGELWDEDRIGFMQVTVVMGRLYAILRGLRRAWPTSSGNPLSHALFLTMPGDDHGLGVAIATEMFRSRGWEIQLETPADQAQAVELLRQCDHTIVGLSASRAGQLGELARLVLALRLCRPEVFVLVSGHIAEAVPDLLEVVDADAVATTAPRAIDTLEELIAAQRRRAARGRGDGSAEA